MPLFCRHNRYTADCPICSREQAIPAATPRSPAATRPGGAKKRQRAKPGDPAPVYKGPFASAGPYVEDDASYEVRLERVPGGLRLAEWELGGLRKRAPVLAAEDLPSLVEEAAEKGALEPSEAERIREALAADSGAAGGVSPGRSGELRDELRAEPLEGGRVRIGRWLFRGTLGWQLQEAPVMLPAARYAEALRGASGVAAAERRT